MSTNDSVLLSVDNLSVEFSTDSGPIRVIDDVSFSLKRSEILGLVGESGSGKSVTSLAIMRLLPKRIARVSSGKVMFGGQDLLTLADRDMQKVRGNRIGMIFQEPLTALNPVFTVGQQIIAAIKSHEHVSTTEAKARAVSLLTQVGIPSPLERMQAYPFHMSGGMRQRVLIAMAIASRPDMLIADEPTTALDVTIQAQILDLLRKIRDETGIAVLFITHDLAVISELCDSVAVFYAGEIQEKGHVDEVFSDPRHPYTRGLLSCIPDPQSGEPLTAIEGRPPAAMKVRTGCQFASRCVYAQASCSTVHPALETAAPGLEVRCLRWQELQATC
jgi:oligopeptide/dipeptide ABC transporter ATP-binding protein